MLQTLHTVAKRWQRDEAGMLAAAVSYYIALSLFPVLMILTSGLGAFFRWTDSGHNARAYLLDVIRHQVAPSLAIAIEQSLAHVEDYSALSGPLGMMFLLMAALAIFAQFERAFDRIWNLQRDDTLAIWNSLSRMLTYRLRAFAMLCGVAVLLVFVFAAGVTIAALKRHIGLASATWFWWAIELVVELGINALAFAALYRFLPKSPVRWNNAAIGGVLTALVWEVGRQSIATLLIGQHYSTAYGIIGSFLAIMLWGYYAVAVILFGAEFVQVLGEPNAARQPERALRAASATSVAAIPANNAATAKQKSLSTRRRSKVIGKLGDFAFATLLLYIALFLGLRHFRSQPIAQGSAARQRIVRFSDNASMNQLALRVFAPLIATLPGPYDYRRK